jgi:negative regulator of flagellin synthesis FlgM
MALEIKGSGANPTSTVDATLRQATPAAPPAASASTPAAEVVTLTDLAARLQRLTASVAQLPVVDQARVAALKEAIDSGEYRIDERAIADKLSAMEALLEPPARP